MYESEGDHLLRRSLSFLSLSLSLSLCPHVGSSQQIQAVLPRFTSCHVLLHLSFQHRTASHVFSISSHGFIWGRERQRERERERIRARALHFVWVPSLSLFYFSFFDFHLVPFLETFFRLFFSFTFLLFFSPFSLSALSLSLSRSLSFLPSLSLRSPHSFLYLLLSLVRSALCIVWRFQFFFLWDPTPTRPRGVDPSLSLSLSLSPTHTTPHTTHTMSANPTLQELAFLNHNLFPFVLRAINDVNGGLFYFRHFFFLSSFFSSSFLSLSLSLLSLSIRLSLYLCVSISPSLSTCNVTLSHTSPPTSLSSPSQNCPHTFHFQVNGASLKPTSLSLV